VIVMTTPANVPQCPSRHVARRQPPPQAFFPASRSEALTLVAVSNAIPLARRITAEVARHWRLPKLFVEDHEVIVSELVTNALNATLKFHKARGITEYGRIKLKLYWNAPRLFTQVWDINPLLPVRREAEEEDTNGRGLGIIEFLCERWDAVHCPEGGKLVWTEQVLS
jgi:hypothetical protein